MGFFQTIRFVIPAADNAAISPDVNGLEGLSGDWHDVILKHFQTVWPACNIRFNDTCNDVSSYKQQTYYWSAKARCSNAGCVKISFDIGEEPAVGSDVTVTACVEGRRKCRLFSQDSSCSAARDVNGRREISKASLISAVVERSYDDEKNATSGQGGESESSLDIAGVDPGVVTNCLKRDANVNVDERPVAMH